MSYPPPPPYGQPYGSPYGYPAYGPPQDHPQAVTILILGICSLLFCSFLGPVALIMGRKALNEIDASGGTIGGRSNIMGGYVCGIIASVLLVLAIAFVVVMVVLGLSGAFDSTSSTY